VPNEVTDPNAK